MPEISSWLGAYILFVATASCGVEKKYSFQSSFIRVQMFKTNNIIKQLTRCLNFKKIIGKKIFFFFAEKNVACKSFSHFFSKNISILDFIFTRRLYKSLTTYYIKLTML